MNHGQTCRLLIGMDSPRQFLGTIRLVQDIIGEGLTRKILSENGCKSSATYHPYLQLRQMGAAGCNQSWSEGIIG